MEKNSTMNRWHALIQEIIFVCLIVTAYVHAQPLNPVADPRSVITENNARFTVLTPELIRLEWSAERSFEDRASLVFINRRLEPPRFTARKDTGWLFIQTDRLKLEYHPDGNSFSFSNLHISFEMNGKTVRWYPGLEDRGNLGGTIRTLDGVKGETKLEPGILSRDGWVLVDDSERPLFDNSDWPWVTVRPSTEHQDWYFFGYGHDYRKAMLDFTKVAGRIPMPPRYAFGLWWSRYWAYTDKEFKNLVSEFRMHDVPLDVLVIDMDWHQTFDLRWGRSPIDQAGQLLGWTGYTWDRNYFPDPEGFLSWCDNEGLKTPLNLHPASGIQPHEDHYPEMARAMGIDPATKKYVPFDIVDKKFATNYMNLIIHPLEHQGVDFWWLDWQQWGTTKIPGVTPTWWLNYVFFTDMERRQAERPLLFHRWGGLGNHRYQIGFSGDVVSVWESLAFQPKFTATAANVGYGYWSHDIGGHMPGEISPELYARWIQWGVFSPILRTHVTKNGKGERRIWAYPNDQFKIMRDAILLRYSLVPYIYTASHNAYETGTSIVHPMYYDDPEAAEAYDFSGEYRFGNDMIVAPVAVPVDSLSLLAEKSVWLPSGGWTEWFTGRHLTGPGVFVRHYTEAEIPVFVRDGAIIPMQPKMKSTHEMPVDPLILTVFPGDSGSCEVYEDEGNSLGYKKNRSATTRVEMKRTPPGDLTVRILPEAGSYPGMKTSRAYELRFVNCTNPESVDCNGKQILRTNQESGEGWKYDGDLMTLIVRTRSLQVNKPVNVRVAKRKLANEIPEIADGLRKKIARLRLVAGMINDAAWPKDWSPDVLIHAEQTGNRISLHPENLQTELLSLQADLRSIPGALDSLMVQEPLLLRVRAHLRDILTP